MNLIYNDIFLEHNTDNHPENKNRLLAIKDYFKLDNSEIISGEKFLKLVHTWELIEKVKKATGWIDGDTYSSQKSYNVACLAVGATIKAAEENAFALCRPPGHHATKDRSMGFCLFNNIAIAAKYLSDQGKKVLILDFDAHYGNGTASIFYDTDEIYYISIHQYPAYPNEGWLTECGTGKGTGHNLPIPLPPFSGDDIFLDCIRIINKKIEKINPDVIAISAGFDGHYSDPLTHLDLSCNSFYQIGKILHKKKIFAALEGGYNLDFLPLCIKAFLDGVEGNILSITDKKTTSKPNVWEEYKNRIEKIGSENFSVS